MHKQLKDQLKRQGLLDTELKPKERWRDFLEAVNLAYCDADHQRELIERSLAITSEKLTARNSELRDKVSELESTRTCLEDSLSTLQTTFDAIGEAILAYDDQGRLVKYNQVAAKMLELDPTKGNNISQQTLIHMYRRLQNPRVLIHDLRYIEQHLDSVRFGLIEFKNGAFFEYHSSPKMVAGQVLGRVWCFRNITEFKKNQALVHHKAYHDSLTNLPNRPLLLDRLTHAVNYARRNNCLTAVVFIDLDHFKKVNDTCGHQQGDQLLRDVATRIGLCLREHDTLSRFGGDEFVILLENLQSFSIATSICTRILAALKKPFAIEQHRFYVSCSMGISIFPRDGTDPQELIRKADMAMYHAKEQGRDNFQYFSKTLERLAMHHVELENRLRLAIKNSELSLAYQPKVDALDHRIVGLEVLLRWNPSNQPSIPPSEFIPIAEQSGLINELGEWVLEQVCQQINHWHQRQIACVPIAVNLSSRELYDKHLVRRIHHILKKYSVPKHLLTIEITETVLMEDLKFAQSVISEIHGLGISVAIDDFGTGYSSMRYLQQLSIDFLKIDKSFTENLPENKQNVAIASTIITLAHNLNMSVIAEGVESDAALAFLRDHKCDQIQGFYFYPPLDKQRAEALLLEHTSSNRNKQQTTKTCNR